MWGAKSLILEDLGWQVGNAETINARDHRWIMKNGVFICFTFLHDDILDFKVGSLIDQDTMT